MNTLSIALNVVLIISICALAFLVLSMRSTKTETQLSPAEIQAAVANAANEQMRAALELINATNEGRLTAVTEGVTAQNTATTTSINALLEPIKETLNKFEKTTQEMEKAREGAYSRLDASVAQTKESLGLLQNETKVLANALSNSSVRGKWGELQVRRILDMMQLKEGVSFEEQKQEQGEGTGRPDFTVKLPNGRTIYIDSKAPMDAYLKYLEESDESRKTEFLKQHEQALRGHIRTLKSRGYASGKASVNYVILFVPTESSLAAAFEVNPELLQQAANDDVVLASPTALIAVLSNVAMLWQEHTQAENAEKIVDESRELHSRLAKFIEHFNRIGKGLKQTNDAFNGAVGSFDRMVMPKALQIETLAAIPTALDSVSSVTVEPTLSTKAVPEISADDEQTA